LTSNDKGKKGGVFTNFESMEEGPLWVVFAAHRKLLIYTVPEAEVNLEILNVSYVENQSFGN